MAYRPQVKTDNGTVDLPLDAETVKGKTILEQTYPVGAIYLSVDSTSPASLFGGTWQQIKALTTIWENPTPNGSYAGQTINNLPNMSDFKYLVFAYRDYYEFGTMYLKVKNENKRFYMSVVTASSSGALAKSRAVIVNSSTSITFGDAYEGASQYNGDCVPVAIYGTNSLDTDEIKYIWKRTA